jgi:hypothetical protein
MRSKASRCPGVGLGEDGDFCGRAGEQELAAGQGTEVREQAPEAAVGAAVAVVLA